MRNLDYKNRLIALKLPTLVYRRFRGDMIECYKLVHGHYDTAHPLLNINHSTSCLRGHPLKLIKNRAIHDYRKFFFTFRVIDTWNNLPQDVVLASSVNCFKNRLDKFWENHTFKYDFEAIWEQDLFC